MWKKGWCPRAWRRGLLKSKSHQKGGSGSLFSWKKRKLPQPPKTLPPGPWSSRHCGKAEQMPPHLRAYLSDVIHIFPIL